VLLESPERLLTPGEVAVMFGVDPKTVSRWASAGRIGSIRTPGGHRRFGESEINRLLTDGPLTHSRPPAAIRPAAADQYPPTTGVMEKGTAPVDET